MARIEEEKKMKNSLDISERDAESDKLQKKNEILLNKLYALDRPEGQIPSQSSGNAAETKWSIKEKLFLISFVLINGDSNWTYVSEQLNKWIESISTSKFECNLNKRTISQCSTQYKLIIANYSKRHGMPDLNSRLKQSIKLTNRKIYNEFVDERLKELKNLTLKSKQQYEDLFKEIDQLVKMDTNSFQQLSELWINLKNDKSFTNRSVNSEQVINKENNISRSSNNFNEEKQLELDVKKILTLNKKQLEKEKQAREAAELERQEAARITAAKIEAEAKLLAEKEEEKKRIAEREAALAELAYKKSLEELTNADSKKQELPQSPAIKQIDSFKIEDTCDEIKETENTLETEVQVTKTISEVACEKPHDKENSPIKLMSIKREILNSEIQSPSRNLALSPTKAGNANQSPISTRSTRRSSDVIAGAEEKKQASCTKTEKKDNGYSSSEDDIPLQKYQLKIKSKKLEQIQEQRMSKSLLTNAEQNSNAQKSKSDSNETDSSKSKFSVFEWKPDVDAPSDPATILTKSPSKSKIETSNSLSQDKSNEVNTNKAPLKQASTPSSPIIPAVSSVIEPVIIKKTVSTNSKNVSEKSTVSSSSSTSTTSSAKSPTRQKRSNKVAESSSSVRSSNSSSNSMSSSSASTSSSASSTISTSGSESEEENQEKSSQSKKNKILKKKSDSKSANKVTNVNKNKEAKTQASPVKKEMPIETSKSSPPTPSSLSKLKKVTKAIVSKKEKDEITEIKPEAEKKPGPSTEKSSTRKLAEIEESKKSSNLNEEISDKKKEQETETSQTPTRQNKKQVTEATIEKSDEKSDTNTRTSLRNKSQTMPIANVASKPRRSTASNKSSSTPQSAQLLSIANTVATPEPKPTNETNSPTQTSNSNFLSSKPASTDSGLISIIKSEPVQISASSTISPNDIEQTNESIVNTTNSSNSSTIKLEEEKAYKAWKKSIMMVLNNITAHKHATVFMHPVRDDIAPGYSSVVKRPMDLSTIKKNIEIGSIKTTIEFQRDVMLMFTNAIMYNSSRHDVHKIAIEMYKEVLTEIEQLINAQEALEEENSFGKPLRFKETRSSTTSDKGAIDSEKNDESTSDLTANIFMKAKRSSLKDEMMETSSIKSSRSSISTHQTSNSNSISNSKRSESVVTSKKRRPSTDMSQSSLVQSKSKRRKSTANK